MRYDLMMALGALCGGTLLANAALAQNPPNASLPPVRPSVPGPTAAPSPVTPPELAPRTIQQALAACDLFISIGTSGNVYPAAGFVALVQRLCKAHTVELNLEPSRGATLFDEAHYGPATQVVPAYVEGLLASSASASASIASMSASDNPS